MDSRKIFEIYKLINDRSIKPVSFWPSIADIPQGMVVLDTDGVVKQKVGDYLVPDPVTIIGSGPLASAPAASAVNQNLFYMSTDFGLCKYVSVFNNAGSDWIDCGRPSWLAQLRPNVDAFFIDVVYSIASYSAVGRVYSLEAASSLETQFSMIPTSNASATYIRIGGAGTINIGKVPINTFVRHTLAGKVPASASQSTLNDNAPVTITSGGSFISPNNLVLGGYSPDPATQNMEGRIACFRVRNGAGAVIDMLDLNKWDGTGTVRFDSGHACMVTDGTPFTAKSYSLIPMSVLRCQ